MASCVAPGQAQTAYRISLANTTRPQFSVDFAAKAAQVQRKKKKDSSSAADDRVGAGARCKMREPPHLDGLEVITVNGHWSV